MSGAMYRIDCLEDESGKLTRVLISDKNFETLSFSPQDDGKVLYAVVLTEDMQDCISQGW